LCYTRDERLDWETVKALSLLKRVLKRNASQVVFKRMIVFRRNR